MKLRDRVLRALDHREPDHVPLDFGGTDVTGINAQAYRAVLPLLGLESPEDIPLMDIVQQLAAMDEEALQRLESHCRPIFPWQI